MYHIKSDKRSLSSAEEITNGLYRCLKDIPLNTVTFSDLHRETGISRATIYRLFDTPEDILLYQVDCMMQWVAQYYKDHITEPPARIFEGILIRGLENHTLMEVLVNNGRFDILHDYTERLIRLYLEISPIFPVAIQEGEADYILSNISMNMVSTLSTWVRRGRTETAEELVHYTRQFIKILTYMTDEEAEGDY